jgi:hypothetical protein
VLAFRVDDEPANVQPAIGLDAYISMQAARQQQSGHTEYTDKQVTNVKHQQA